MSVEKSNIEIEKVLASKKFKCQPVIIKNIRCIKKIGEV